MVVTDDSEERHEVTGKVGFPYFGRLIEDTLNGTDLAVASTYVDGRGSEFAGAGHR